MPIRIFTVIFFSFLSFFSEAMSMDLSGWFRMESYNQPQKNYHYVTNQLVLRPEIHFLEDFQVNFQLDLNPRADQFDPFNSYDLYPQEYLQYRRQTGTILFYTDHYMNQRKKVYLPFIYLNLSQLYLKYENDWTTIRFGRAPYHFGMGITHSAPEDHSTKNFLSIFNQFDVLMKFSEFYIRSLLAASFFREYALIETGFSKDDWAIASLYKVSGAHININDNNRNIRTIETFGRYKKDNWELKISNSFMDGYGYDKDEENNLNLLQAIEFRIEIPGETSLEFEIKAGRALGRAAFHSNYNVALIHWNRESGFSRRQLEIEQTKLGEFFFGDIKSTIPYFIENGQIYKSSYLSSSFNFSFEQGKFTLKPLFLLASDDATENPNISYEFNLEGRYNLTEKLSFILQGGIAYNYQGLDINQKLNHFKKAKIPVKIEKKSSWKNWFKTGKQEKIVQALQQKQKRPALLVQTIYKF